jgi:hypothetical protein
MPQRILRDWTDSEVIDSLKFEEEVMFTRLIMKADDFGNFHAKTQLIKSLLFPLKDGIRVSDIDRWLKNIEAAGLIRFYTHNGSPFLHIVKFGQRLRQTKRIFPEPSDFQENINLSATRAQLVSNSPPEEKRREVEVEVEGEGDKIANTHPPELVESYKKFNNWLSEHTPRVLELKHKITIEQYQKLKSAYPDMKQPVATLKAMHNFKPLTKNYVDAYLTLVKWMKKDEQFTN